MFDRYVAMGTSVSMGWQSDGLTAVLQRQSWPAQLAERAGRPFSLPLISGVGCRSPLVTPLASGVRESGESAAQPAASAQCDPLQAGITLPTRNVAIAGALTLDALQTTPELHQDPFYRKLYPLILPPNTTQLLAMKAQSPTFVSVEFGANEVLGARSGVAIPGVTMFPFATWVSLYNTLTAEVARSTTRGLLVGLIADVASFPSFRRGGEIWSDRQTLLAAFHVAVNRDCADSRNLLFLAVRIPVAVATAAAYRSNGLPPFDFRCSDGGQGVQDYVLTPAEAGVVNQQLAMMNNHIRRTGDRLGFAVTNLDALYGRPGLKAPYSTVQMLTGKEPYGPLISYDGIHPSGAGHAILADAAARAIRAEYGFRFQEPVVVASR
jgi:hypothetical protein